MPFVSYVFLVREVGGRLIPQDAGERIISFRRVPPSELPKVAASLRALTGEWHDWGRFRAIAHDFVAEMLGG